MDAIPDCSGHARWFKSSYSNDQGGACVEGAHLSDGGIAVRDSKVPEGPVLRISADTWACFLGGARAGAFAPR